MFKKFKEKINSNIFGLKAMVEEMKLNIKCLEEEVEKLKRISKYSSPVEDIPTHRLVRVYDIADGFYYNMVNLSNDLYIYYKKEEYKIRLDELKDECSIGDTEKLRLDGDLVYFDLTSHSKYDSSKYFATNHHFIIDYLHGTYIHTSEPNTTYMRDKIKEGEIALRNTVLNAERKESLGTKG